MILNLNQGCKLNINGLSNVNKQLQLLDFVNLHNVDILMLQEHNSKSLYNLHVNFKSFFHIKLYLNPSINSKGDTTLYANTCMLSKIWYTAHNYPLTEQFAKQINTIIFQYIWFYSIMK